uniref:Possible Photosystem II Psb27 protein n=1 Tax=Paulinella chromatophora TaxID=39717 RepID=B1X5S2_PAUCH|nr:possible Photosystem II Psb27 protein [Paulinella chromatophora]ACB43291.1 possible Photosystem II Psb27 protein [Paulinella chromatophora]|eukprot:gb/GEZN01003393.1/.p2 GENE.gb/GEZN01003393.1/~~gb/GEZN01003393.1/.p2  ORF type:complete len:139 (-),score=1.40 gb/GEZN01003393.1/:1203-1619(-)
MVSFLRFFSGSMVAASLSLCLFLTACNNTSGNSPLTGVYIDDTITVSQTLLNTITLAQDDMARSQAETESRALINDYMARYRPQSQVNGLSSFTTMQTAVNSLAGHYASYANRPLPEELKERLTKELKKAAASVVKGA